MQTSIAALTWTWYTFSILHYFELRSDICDNSWKCRWSSSVEKFYDEIQISFNYLSPSLEKLIQYTEKWLEDSMNNCSATNAGSINYNLITIYRVGMNDSFQRAISHLQLLLLVGNSGVHLSSSQLESQHRIRSNEWVRSSEWRTERKMSIHVGRIYYIRWTGLEFVIQAAKRNEFN